MKNASKWKESRTWDVEYRKAVTERFKKLWPSFNAQFIQEAKRMGNGPGGGRHYQEQDRKGERNPILVTLRDPKTRQKIFDLVMENPRDNRDIRRYQDQRHNVRTGFCLRKKKELIEAEPDLIHEVEYSGKMAMRIVSMPRLDPVTAKPLSDIVERYRQILESLGVEVDDSGAQKVDDKAGGGALPKITVTSPQAQPKPVVPQPGTAEADAKLGKEDDRLEVKRLSAAVDQAMQRFQKTKSIFEDNPASGNSGGGGGKLQVPPHWPLVKATHSNPPTPPAVGLMADRQLQAAQKSLATVPPVAQLASMEAEPAA